MFQQVAAISSIPSTSTGVNTISLLPVVNCPTLAAYTELCGFRFRASGNSTSTVTLQFAGLGFLPLYLADGVTQANVGSILSGVEYVATFSQSLNSGSGGFFLEAPAVPVASQATSFAPGGRLTVQSGVPVMNASQTSQLTLYYAPYIHSFCPVYNGSIIVMQQFTSGLSDIVGLSIVLAGSANWPANTVHDVFMTLVAGVPTLCTVQWTSNTVRATLLAIFGGFLTNASLATARTTPSITISLAANQGSYLGTIWTGGGIGTVPGPANGALNFVFGGSASGGTGSLFGVYNYYNQALFLTRVVDSGASYTYTSGIARQARASNGNEIAWVSGAAEKQSLFTYRTIVQTASAASSSGVVGMGLDTSISFSTNIQLSPTVATALFSNVPSIFEVQTLGAHLVTAMEAGDGTNANTFDVSSTNALTGSIWL